MLYKSVDKLPFMYFEASELRILYLLAAVWPPGKEAKFTKLLDRTSLIVKDCLQELVSRNDIMNEFTRFNQVKTSAYGLEWEGFKPLQLYRFFFFIQSFLRSIESEEDKSPILYSLRLKVFDKLLILLKNGNLDAKYCECLIYQANLFLNLQQRLENDTLSV